MISKTSILGPCPGHHNSKFYEWASALLLKQHKDVEGRKETDNVHDNNVNRDDNAIIKNSIKLSIALHIPGTVLSKIATHSQVRNLKPQEVQDSHMSLIRENFETGIQSQCS